MRGIVKQKGLSSLSKLNLLYALLLGALPTLLILSSPLNLNKYDVDLTVRAPNRLYWFDDLEDDHKKEQLSLGYNPDSSIYLVVVDDKESFVGQFNFEFPLTRARTQLKPEAHDINRDGIREIILFTQKRDSLFINAFDYGQLDVVLESRFVTTIGGFNGKKDYHLHSLGWHDANMDGLEEFYFSVAAGFALYPRRVFRYDFVNDSLLRSINTGASNLYGNVFNTDYGFNLLVLSNASSNVDASYPYPYHDTCGWILNFDEDLVLISPPVSVGSYPSQGEPVMNIANCAFCVYTSFNAAAYRTIIMEFSPKGEIIDSLIIPNQTMSGIIGFGRQDERIYASSREDIERAYVFGIHPLRMLPPRNVKFLKGKFPMLQEDLDMDGKFEVILKNRKTLSYEFYPNEQFKNGFNITPLTLGTVFITAKYSLLNEKGSIAFCSARDSEIYEYSENPVYKLRFFIWLLIYTVSVAFVSGVMYLQRRRMLNQQKLEHQVADLQLQNLRNQLDPHFTFNALNSVGNAIYQENKEKAYDLFQRFTRMIRSSLMVSQQVFRPLHDEIQFTTDYLEFQKTRFRERFDYSFEIDPDLDLERSEIPKMLIQGFAENAVKHAFHGIGYKGQITISIQKEARGIKITIEDNGIGIKRSKELGATSGTQKGEQIIQAQIKQINKLYNQKISCKIVDNAVISEKGTRVEVLLTQI